MIRIGVFTGADRNEKPQPVIIKTEGVSLTPSSTSKIVSSIKPNNKQS